KDWPSMGAVTEYLTQQQPGGLERDLPNYAVVPNWLGCLQDKGQYIRPGEYAGWLGQAYNPMTTSIKKKEIADNPYWRDCTDAELDFELKGLAPEVSLNTLRRRTSLLDEFEAEQKRLGESEGSAYGRLPIERVTLSTFNKNRPNCETNMDGISLGNHA
ncbi:DUF1501 domain-containing protein, partial [bacterium]|nr:DUF1501 domain-containing protein [bacterium]